MKKYTLITPNNQLLKLANYELVSPHPWATYPNIKYNFSGGE